MPKNNPHIFAKEIMSEMERRGFTQGEAELAAMKLKEEIKMNSERIRKSKTFTVHRIIKENYADEIVKKITKTLENI